jgi:hypothetical protein
VIVGVDRADRVEFIANAAIEFAAFDVLRRERTQSAKYQTDYRERVQEVSDSH